MLAATEYDNILELFAARQNSWFIIYNEVALKKVGHIAYYSANCSCIKHSLYLLACNIPKFFVMLLRDVLLLNLALSKKYHF